MADLADLALAENREDLNLTNGFQMGLYPNGIDMILISENGI